MRILVVMSVVLLSACAGLKIESHDFPKAVASRMASEKCDCDRIEFVGVEEEGYVFDEAGARSKFSYQKDTFRVDVDSISNNLLSLVLGQPTFSEVRQSAEVHNPFDGKDYTIHGIYDAAGLRVVLALKGQGNVVGELTADNAAHIYAQAYRLEEDRWWNSRTEEASAKGKTVWHQYGEGGYLRISDEAGDETRIFQGEILGTPPNLQLQSMDMNYVQSVVYLPRGKDRYYRRNVFLFYFAMQFFQEFVEDIRDLPQCLADTQNSDACPERLLTY